MLSRWRRHSHLAFRELLIPILNICALVLQVFEWNVLVRLHLEVLRVRHGRDGS